MINETALVVEDNFKHGINEDLLTINDFMVYKAENAEEAEKQLQI